MGPPTAASADGVAYPSKQSIAVRFEPSAPPSPTESPHTPGVGWAGDIQVHTFDRDSQSGNRPQEVVAHLIPDFVMTLRTHISTLRWLVRLRWTNSYSLLAHVACIPVQQRP